MENQVSEQKQEDPSSNPVILSSDDEEETPRNNYQIVVYDPNSNGVLEPDPIQTKSPTNPGSNPGSQRVLPAVGTFTVQCANCFKWRLIPSKEKYEEIREHILEQPFLCELAKEWRPEISCDVDGDIEQDDGRLWAIDKPNIAQPPPGWERELRIRGEGSSKFADVFKAEKQVEPRSRNIGYHWKRLEAKACLNFNIENESKIILGGRMIAHDVARMGQRPLWQSSEEADVARRSLPPRFHTSQEKRRYYISPAGKRLRSMVEVQRYLLEHPEFMSEGVTLSQFSFRIPKPLREDYVRKRTARLPLPDGSNFGMPLQTIAANPISWVAPDDTPPLQIGGPVNVTPPVQKKARLSPMATNTSNPLQRSPPKFKIKGPRLPPNSVYDL